MSDNFNGVLQGVSDIALYCGVTKERIRVWISENPDFPARRDGRNGAWITTRRALLNWLDDYVSRPARAAMRGEEFLEEEGCGADW